MSGPNLVKGRRKKRRKVQEQMEDVGQKYRGGEKRKKKG